MIIIAIGLRSKSAEITNRTTNKQNSKKKEDSDVSTSMNYGVASSSSWPNSICNPKRAW